MYSPKITPSYRFDYGQTPRVEFGQLRNPQNWGSAIPQTRRTRCNQSLNSNLGFGQGVPH